MVFQAGSLTKTTRWSPEKICDKAAGELRVESIEKPDNNEALEVYK